MLNLKQKRARHLTKSEGNISFYLIYEAKEAKKAIYFLAECWMTKCWRGKNLQFSTLQWLSWKNFWDKKARINSDFLTALSTLWQGWRIIFALAARLVLILWLSENCTYTSFSPAIQLCAYFYNIHEVLYNLGYFNFMDQPETNFSQRGHTFVQILSCPNLIGHSQ